MCMTIKSGASGCDGENYAVSDNVASAAAKSDGVERQHRTAARATDSDSDRGADGIPGVVRGVALVNTATLWCVGPCVGNHGQAVPWWTDYMHISLVDKMYPNVLLGCIHCLPIFFSISHQCIQKP